MKFCVLLQQSFFFYIPSEAHFGCAVPLFSHPVGIVTCFPVIKRSECEAAHPPTYSTKVKNNCSCTSSAAYLHAVASNIAQGQSDLSVWKQTAHNMCYTGFIKHAAPSVVVGTTRPGLIQRSYWAYTVSCD